MILYGKLNTGRLWDEWGMLGGAGCDREVGGMKQNICKAAVGKYKKDKNTSTIKDYWRDNIKIPLQKTRFS